MAHRWSSFIRNTEVVPVQSNNVEVVYDRSNRGRVIDGMAEISVTDTGVGIAPEDQEAVFEEFRQVGTRRKRRKGPGWDSPCAGSSSNSMAGGSVGDEPGGRGLDVHVHDPSASW